MHCVLPFPCQTRRGVIFFVWWAVCFVVFVGVWGRAWWLRWDRRVVGWWLGMNRFQRVLLFDMCWPFVARISWDVAGGVDEVMNLSKSQSIFVVFGIGWLILLLAILRVEGISKAVLIIIVMVGLDEIQWHPQFCKPTLTKWQNWLTPNHCPLFVSVCKSSLITGKRLEPDWTRTYQDRKLVRPFRTITTVWSMVHHNSENLKTEQRPVLTGLSSLKVMQSLTGLGVCNFCWKLRSNWRIF